MKERDEMEFCHLLRNVAVQFALIKLNCFPNHRLQSGVVCLSRKSRQLQNYSLLARRILSQDEYDHLVGQIMYRESTTLNLQ